MDNFTAVDIHSQHSLKNSTLTVKEIVEKAKEAGADSVTLTDLYAATGLIEFMTVCKKEKINGIPGITLRFRAEPGMQESDIVLLAKSYDGYKNICRIIYKAYEKMENGDKLMPPIDYDILKEYSKDIVVLTGGTRGVLASIMFNNEKIYNEVSVLEKKLSAYNNPEDPGYLHNMKLIAEKTEKIEELEAEKKKLDALSKKTYSKRYTGLSVISEDKRAAEEAKIKAEEAETKEAAEKLPSVVNAIKKLKREVSVINGYVRQISSSHKQYSQLKEKIDGIKAGIIPKENLQDKMLEVAEKLRSIVGNENFFIELSYHGDPEENIVMPSLCDTAKRGNFNVAAGQLARVLDKNDAEKYSFIMSMDAEKRLDTHEWDGEYYIKNEQELFESLKGIFPADVSQKAIEGDKKIGQMCRVVFPEASHYPRFIDDKGNVVEDTKALLRKKAREGVTKILGRENFTKEYEKRMDYELEVISNLGYADYLLIVADFIGYARQYAKDIDPNGIGYGIGPGRGSAAGSLVCYLLGITEIDPLKYGLIFERFLNKDRVSMPDIDTDLSKEVRGATIEYVKRKYGSESVASICTLTTQKAKASIRNVTRTLGYYYYGNDAKDTHPGEIKELTALADAMSKSLPQNPDLVLSEYEAELRDKFADEPHAKDILDKALATEKIITNTGIHAAGVIIGDGEPLKDYVPLIYDPEKEQWAVQCDKEQAEKDMGLLKMDFLGLINLDVITECLRRVKNTRGITIDADHLPFEDEVFSEIFSKGKTGSVFQFESDGMKRMLKDFRPETFEDIILLVAAYRPGPMESIPNIINNKHGRTKPDYLIPQLEDILSKTYGYPIYQEQLMDICHRCAGFTLGEADIIRKAMSKKKVEQFLGYKEDFINGIVRTTGGSAENAEKLWNSLVNFAKYAFNKSHAAAYAYVAYITAYLKYHYPAEYMCAVLNNAKIEKIPALLTECKNMGLKVTVPDINKADTKFNIEHDSIIYGLGNIKSFPSAKAEEIVKERKNGGKFKSFPDFLYRCRIGKSNIEKLIKCGAFDFFHKNRQDLLDLLTEAQGYVDIITSKEKILADKSNGERKKDNAESARSAALFELQNIVLPEDMDYLDDVLLGEEVKLLGSFITRHPMDSYKHVYNNGVTRISDVELGNCRIAGIITNLRNLTTKSGGKAMAFFTLEDASGSIPVCCFSEAFRRCKDLISENNIVVIDGRVATDDREEGQEIKFIVKEMGVCPKYAAKMLVTFENESARKEFYRILPGYADENGNMIYTYKMYGTDKDSFRIADGEAKASDKLLNSKINGVKVFKYDF